VASVSIFARFTGANLKAGHYHYWETKGFGGNSAISISAIAASGVGNFTRVLVVENVRYQSRREGELVVSCNVRNVGSDPIPTYQVNFAAISP
jgi:hypothetical protein